MAGKMIKVVRLSLERLYDENGQFSYPYNELFALRKQVGEVKNRTIQMLWEWDGLTQAFSREGLEAPTPKQYTGKSMAGHIYDLLKSDFPMMYSQNLSSTIRGAMTDYGNAKKDMRAGRRSIMSYRSDGPIEIHNQRIHLSKIDQHYFIALNVFSDKHAEQQGYSGTAVKFKVFRAERSQMEILERCMSGSYKIGASKLLFSEKKKSWFLNLTYKFEPVKPSDLDPERIMGVDLGIACVAYMGFLFCEDRYYIPGGEVEQFRRKVEARRRSLQQQGRVCGDGRIGHGYHTRNKPALQLSDSIKRFRDTANHKYSRYIINMAVKHGCGTIQMEDLHGIPTDEKLLQDWTYFDLRTKLEYKAAEKGIRLIFVDPRHTSQRCSKCGHIDPANRTTQAKFRCTRCGFEANADYNASLNLATPNIEKIIQKEKEKRAKSE